MERRIAGHFAQLRIVLHVRCILVWQGKHDGCPAFVELQLEPRRFSFLEITMQVGNQHRPNVEPDGTDSPRHALTEIGVGRHSHSGLRHQNAASISFLVGQAG
jgi:hypothetical protein